MAEIAQFKTKREAEHAAKQLRHSSYSGSVTYSDQGRCTTTDIIVHSAVPEQVRRGLPWRVCVRFSTPALNPAWGYASPLGNIVVQAHHPKQRVKATDSTGDGNS